MHRAPPRVHCRSTGDDPHPGPQWTHDPEERLPAPLCRHGPAAVEAQDPFLTGEQFCQLPHAAQIVGHDEIGVGSRGDLSDRDQGDVDPLERFGGDRTGVDDDETAGAQLHDARHRGGGSAKRGVLDHDAPPPLLRGGDDLPAVLDVELLPDVADQADDPRPGGPQ